MYLIWILRPKLIRSINQSRATLWVLETCLIVGLLPLMIILITASLSSNTYNKASWWEELTFEGTRSTLCKSLITPWDCFCTWFLSRQTTGYPSLSWFSIRFHKSRTGILSNLFSASKEMISVSVELCETGSLLLTHPTQWNNCMTSQDAPCSTRSRFGVLKISREVGVLKQFQPALFCSITHMTILSVFTCVMIIWIEVNRFRRLSQALVHLVIDRASLFTDQRISGLPVRPKYTECKTIWEHTCDTSPTDFISSCLKWWSSVQGVDILKSCSVVLVLTHNIAPHISSHDLASHRTMKKYENSRSMEAFQFTPLKFAIRTFLCNCPQYFSLFHKCHWVHPRFSWSRKDVGSPKSTSSLSTFHIGSRFCFFPANFYVIHIHR